MPSKKPAKKAASKKASQETKKAPSPREPVKVVSRLKRQYKTKAEAVADVRLSVQDLSGFVEEHSDAAWCWVRY